MDTKRKRPDEMIAARLADLRQTADEIRLKLHLAGMDAQKAWKKLAPKLVAVERRLESTGRAVLSRTAKGLSELGKPARRP